MALKIEGAPNAIAIAVVQVGPISAVEVVAARPSRRKLYLAAGGDVRFGSDSAVTAATGLPSLNVFVDGATPLETAAAIWAIAGPNNNSPGGVANVYVIETYDEEA